MRAEVSKAPGECLACEGPLIHFDPGPGIQDYWLCKGCGSTITEKGLKALVEFGHEIIVEAELGEEPGMPHRGCTP